MTSHAEVIWRWYVSLILFCIFLCLPYCCQKNLLIYIIYVLHFKMQPLCV